MGIPDEPCAHERWSTRMVELAREGAEAINLDQCDACGRFRLSWWWPKDSSDTAMGAELPISATDALRIREETDWVRRKRLVEGMIGRAL